MTEGHHGPHGAPPGDDGNPIWPTYPAGPDFLAPGGQRPQGSPPGAQAGSGHRPAAPAPPHAAAQPSLKAAPASYPQGPAYPPPPRQSKGPVIALIATLAVLGLIAIAGIGGVLFLRNTSGDPSPSDPPTSAPAEPRSQPTGEILPAPPGRPAEGALKERLDQQFGSFEPIVRSGTGPAVIELPPEARRGLLWAKTDGADWFSVQSVPENGLQSPLFYSGEAAQGTVGFGLRSRAPRPVRLLVETTDASWELAVRPISSAPVLGEAASGTGMALLIHDGPAKDVQLDYRGDANFIVVQHGIDDTTHHANEIGSTTIESTLTEGLSVLEIEAWRSGEWGVRDR
ncbi:hypothetical protein [Granulicoccus sp. GXG6511]|uniref:hypothetical protein n=1 Tax=Granulicoccus sp. GXG6511 TaxID=3381351 RepID=UPI003D7D5540